MSDNTANEPVTQANLLRRMQTGWDALQTYLDSQRPARLTEPVDAVGWTVKDHIMHLATWEDGMALLLQGKSQREGMDIDEATWQSGEDAINAAIQARYRDITLAEARRLHQASHQRLVAQVAAMSDADILRPYRDFQPSSQSENPVYGWIIGNTFGHYEEHHPWMAAIAEQG